MDLAVITAAHFSLNFPTPLFFIMHTYDPPGEILPLPVCQFCLKLRVAFYNTFYIRDIIFLFEKEY